MLNFIKKILAITFLLISILVLFSCGVNQNNIFKSYDFGYEKVEAETEYAINTYASMDMREVEGNMKSMKATTPEFDAVVEPISAERKIIKNYNFSLQTLYFDDAYNNMINKITELSAVVDNSSFNNGNIKNAARSVDMTVRVPLDYVEKFIEYIESNSSKLNVTFKSESKQDVTDNYNDTLLRMTTLNAELNKLQEFMKKTTKVEDLIQIEDRISNVSYEIQRLENRIKNYDSQINYSTIYLNILEVKVLTETEQYVPSWDKILQAFHNNFNDTVNYVKNVLVYLFTHIPAICFSLIVLLIVLILISIIRSVFYKKNSGKLSIADTNKKIVSNLMKKNLKHIHNNVDIVEDTKVNKNTSHDDIVID